MVDGDEGVINKSPYGGHNQATHHYFNLIIAPYDAIDRIESFVEG